MRYVVKKLKWPTSPPSPELDFPPILFIAIAIASCVSLEMAPRDIPPVQKRSTMEVAGSTLPIGIGVRSLFNSRRSRRTYREKDTMSFMVTKKQSIIGNLKDHYLHWQGDLRDVVGRQYTHCHFSHELLCAAALTSQDYLHGVHLFRENTHTIIQYYAVLLTRRWYVRRKDRRRH